MATLQEELEARHKLDAMLADFERQTRTDTTNPGAIFREVLNSTPGLREQYERAVREGNLVGLEVEKDPRFNGSYHGDSRKMSLSVDQLNEAGPPMIRMKFATRSTPFATPPVMRSTMHTTAKRTRGGPSASGSRLRR